MWDFINKHVKLVFFVILTSTVLMALIVVWKVNSLQKEIDVIPLQVNKINALGEIKENILLQTAAMNSYIVTGKQEYLSDFRKYTPLNTKLQVELLEAIRDSRKPLVRQLINNYESYIYTCEKDIVSYITSGSKVPESAQQQVLERKKTLLDLASQIQNMRKNDTLIIINNAVNNSKNATLTTVLFTLFGSIIGASLSLVIGSRFIRNHKIHNGILNNTRNINITIDEKGFITSVNNTARSFFDIPDNIYKKKFDEVIGINKPMGIDLPISKVITSGMGVCNMERAYTAPDGWKGTLNVDCLPLDTQVPCGVLVVARDISDRKILEEKLYVMTLRDGLTGLFNHAYLKRKLQKEIATAKANNYSLAFILMDIDNFKFYNDRFGHLEGDELLKEFSELLTSCVRTGDIVGRYGGDEFAVILPRTGRDNAALLAERIRVSVEEYPFLNKELMPQGKFTVCIGVSVYPDDATTGEEIIRLADEAMYRGKRNSKNEVQLYSSALKDFQKRMQQSERSRFNVVQVLLSIINAKDRDTFLHLEKVAEYVGLICENMNLGESQTKDITLAALLHDVGKIEIPRTILTKTETLNKAEWSIVKQHPKWGANMVLSMQSLDNIIPMIMHHHEKYDGTGYPYQLKEEEIPLGSRIIAVADSFDAITTSRPYKEAKNYFEALEEIKRCSGTQFDPQVVDVFHKAFVNKHCSNVAFL